MRLHSRLACFLVVGLVGLLLPPASAATAATTGIAHEGAVRQLAFDSSGAWLLSMDESTVKSWSLAEGKRVGRATIAGGATLLRCSPTEPLVAIFRKVENVELRTIPDLRLVRSWKTEGHVSGMAFSADGGTLATCTFDGMQFWSTSAGTRTGEFTYNMLCEQPAFSPDGRWLAAAGDFSGQPRLSLWPLEAGASAIGRQWTRPVATMGAHRDGEGAYFTVSFTPDSNHLVAGSNMEEFALFPVPSGRPAVVKEDGPKGMSTVTVSGDGKTLLSAHRGTVRLVTLPDGIERLSFEGHEGEVHAIASSPDKTTFATGGADRAIRLWYLADGALVRELVDRAAARPAARATTAAKADAASQPTGKQTGLVVAGRLITAEGKPVANIALKLPLAYPEESGGIFYSFAPGFHEATTDSDGRFRFEGVEAGKRYALVTMSGGPPSPLKAADGSTLLIDIASGARKLDLGAIRWERP